MSQDKRDKNNTDRAQDSAKADDQSRSNGSKTSEASSSSAAQASTSDAGKRARSAADSAQPRDTSSSSGAGNKNATDKHEAKPGPTGGESSKPDAAPRREAGSGNTGNASAGRSQSDKSQPGKNQSDKNPPDKSRPSASASSSANKPVGTPGAAAGGGADKRVDSGNAAAASSNTPTSSTSATSAGKSSGSGAAGKGSPASAGTKPRPSASNTSSESSGATGKSSTTSSAAPGTSAGGASGGGRSGASRPGQPEKDGRRRSVGLVVAVIALIVAILAAAFSGYLWYRGQQRLTDLDSRIDTVKTSLHHDVHGVVMPKLSQVRHRMQKLSQQTDQLSQQTHELSQRTDQLSQTLNQRQQHIAQLQQTIQHVQAQNKQLSDQLGGNHERFVEQRIALLLEAANQRLQVEHDPKGAAQALSLADQAIQNSGDQALHPVRAKIADEMAAIKALPNPDIEGLSLKLSNMIQQIPKLPLKSNVPSHYQPSSSKAGSATSGGKSGQTDDSMEFAGIKLAKKWHQFVNSVGNALSRMVTIRHANGTENAPALMAPEQSYFLVQNLQLQLRTARLALLGRNAQTYDEALAEARDWIQKYFDTSDSAVSSVLDDLSQLSQVKLKWQAPDLSSSLNTLHQIMNRDQNSGSGSSSAGGGQPNPSGSSSDGGHNKTQDKPNSDAGGANAAEGS